MFILTYFLTIVFLTIRHQKDSLFIHKNYYANSKKNYSKIVFAATTKAIYNISDNEIKNVAKFIGGQYMKAEKNAIVLTLNDLKEMNVETLKTLISFTSIKVENLDNSIIEKLQIVLGLSNTKELKINRKQENFTVGSYQKVIDKDNKVVFIGKVKEIDKKNNILTIGSKHYDLTKVKTERASYRDFIEFKSSDRKAKSEKSFDKYIKIDKKNSRVGNLYYFMACLTNVKKPTKEIKEQIELLKKAKTCKDVDKVADYIKKHDNIKRLSAKEAFDLTIKNSKK